MRSRPSKRSARRRGIRSLIPDYERAGDPVLATRIRTRRTAFAAGGAGRVRLHLNHADKTDDPRDTPVGGEGAFRRDSRTSDGVDAGFEARALPPKRVSPAVHDL